MVALRYELGKIMTRLGQDLRYALRQLHKNGGYSAIAIVTLAVRGESLGS
jgi:hypothetical protein